MHANVHKPVLYESTVTLQTGIGSLTGKANERRSLTLNHLIRFTV